MNPRLDVPSARPASGATVGAVPPELAALALGVVVAVLALLLGGSAAIAVGAGAIAAAVTGLLVAACRIGEAWARGEGP